MILLGGHLGGCHFTRLLLTNLYRSDAALLRAEALPVFALPPLAEGFMSHSRPDREHGPCMAAILMRGAVRTFTGTPGYAINAEEVGACGDLYS